MNALVLAGFLLVASLPLLFISAALVLVVLSTIAYTLVVGSPFLAAGFLALRYVRRAE